MRRHIVLLMIFSFCNRNDGVSVVDGTSIVNIYQGLPINNITYTLQQIIQRLDSLQSVTEKCACNAAPTVLEPDTQDDFAQAGCATDKPAVFTNGVLNLDGTGPGSWPAAGFCRVYSKAALAGTTYNISADLYNVKSGGGTNSGHLGVFYNAQDINNYDFVYFRFHSASSCYQTGQIVNGALNWSGSKSAACANGVPAGATWFNVKVEVSGGTAKIYRDGVLMVTVTPHFSLRASGGVLVANGYANLGRFRNVKIAGAK